MEIGPLQEAFAPGVLIMIGSAIVWLCKRFLDKLDNQFNRIVLSLENHERRITRVETKVETIIPHSHAPAAGLELRTHPRT